MLEMSTFVSSAMEFCGNSRAHNRTVSAWSEFHALCGMHMGQEILLEFISWQTRFSGLEGPNSSWNSSWKSVFIHPLRRRKSAPGAGAPRKAQPNYGAARNICWATLPSAGVKSQETDAKVSQMSRAMPLHSSAEAPAASGKTQIIFNLCKAA